MTRVVNFCAGPCTLPVPVLQDVQAELLDFRGSGMSLLELSHRSAAYEEVHHDAMAAFRSFFEVPAEYEVLFLQGGATLAFSLLPLNLLRAGEPAGYVRSGSWGRAALADAAVYGDAYAAWDGAGEGYARMPADDELTLRESTAYLHVTSNETIEGIRYPRLPDVGLPLVVDMSSEFLARRVPWERVGVVYGGVQKNLGPAGLVVLVVRRDLLGRGSAPLGSYLRLGTHADKDSLLNTPPMFPIYVMGKVLRWLADAGGLDGVETRAAARSAALYEVIDASGGFFSGPARPDCRSHMNVVFTLPSAELDARFVQEAAEQGMVNLAGHRSVGGVRASLYAAMPDEGVTRLGEFMGRFAEAHG